MLVSVLNSGNVIHLEQVNLSWVDSFKSKTAKVISFIGEGGQGYVYKVECDGKLYALKWYKKETYLNKTDKVAFRKNLSKNIEDGPPKVNGSPASQFLWPLALARETDGTFGYVMELFPDSYISFSDYYWGKAYHPTWKSLVDVALCLVESFMILHRNGKSYQDLNHGAFRTSPHVAGVDRKVLICDNDNVAPDRVNLGIRGFPGFMAPEVELGEALPSTLTDLHSLAVVLFGLFFRGHPLEGQDTTKRAALMTASIRRDIYGLYPMFCYHPTNDRNRPDPIVHSEGVMHYWPIFPKEFRNYFTKAFTVGLRDPNKRVLEVEWLKALIDLRSSIVYTGPIKPGKTPPEQFVELSGNQMPSGSCRLKFEDGRIVAISNGVSLYACHTSGDISDFRTVTGWVAYQEDTKRLVMVNNTETVWHYSVSGQSQSVAPKKMLPIVSGMTISFAGIKATVY